jgi:hypothetical protein
MRKRFPTDPKYINIDTNIIHLFNIILIISFFIISCGRNDSSGICPGPSEVIITSSDGEANDRFAGDWTRGAIAGSGNRVLVGAHEDDIGAFTDAGSAYIYEFNGLTWTEKQQILPSVSADNEIFGMAVALDGDIAVIGAEQYEQAGGLLNGAAYVFRYNSGADTWNQTHKLINSDNVDQSYFGSAVAIDGERLLISAFGNNKFGVGSNVSSGRAYIFDYNAGTDSWDETILLNPDQTMDDYFGYSAALDNNTAVIGTRPGAGHTDKIGEAYVFFNDGGTWSKQDELHTALTNGGGTRFALDKFGTSVSVEGDIAVVGAYDGSGTPGTGKAYIFRRTGIDWSLLQTLTPGDGANGDAFGAGVIIENNVIVVSAPYHDVGAVADAGSLYVFEYNSGTDSWDETVRIDRTSPDSTDEFGAGLAFMGTKLLTGAGGDSSSKGAALLYCGYF